MKNPPAILDEKVEHLAGEIKATFTERIYAARDEVIKAHHETGKLIADYVKEEDCKPALLIKQLVQLGAGTETTLFLSHAFFKKFPTQADIDRLGQGKNISWNKIRRALAPNVEEKIIEEKTPRGFTAVGTMYGHRVLVETENEDTLEQIYDFLKEVNSEFVKPKRLTK